MMYMDDDILDELRDRADTAGRADQTRINETLWEYLGWWRHPLDEAPLRWVIREELKKIGYTWLGDLGGDGPEVDGKGLAGVERVNRRGAPGPAIYEPAQER